MIVDLSNYDWHQWPVIAARVTYRDADGDIHRRWAFFEIVDRKWDGFRSWPLNMWKYQGTKRLTWHTRAFRLVCLAALIAAIWVAS